MQYEITTQIPTVSEYQFLREAVGWHNHPTTIAAQSLQNSLYSVCAVHENDVVGCGRVVGDGYIYFYLQDVIVLPKYQGYGIGSKITENIKNYVLSIAQPGAFFGLMAAAGASSMYEKFGFKCRPQNMPGMFMWVGQDLLDRN
jgi:ribosomal protein S18 acetylase RimI-like enzyme